MGLLRDLQRKVGETSTLLGGGGAGGGGGASDTYFGALDDNDGVLGSPHGSSARYAADVLRPQVVGTGGGSPPSAGSSRSDTPKRAPFAASSTSSADDDGGARPVGSRYYTSRGGGDAAAGTTTPIWLTALNIMNGVIGAGIIALPYAIYQSGLPWGIVLCLAVAVMSNWTVRLLANLGQAHEAATYEDLAYKAFGPVGYYTVCLCQGAFSFGAMVTYLVIVGDLLPAAVGAWGWYPPDTGYWQRRDVTLALPSIVLLLPLCLYRAYGQLAKYSIIKAVSILFLAVVVVVFKFSVNVTSTKSDDWKYREIHADFFPAIGTIAFAFVCHHQTFLAWRSLKHATQRRFAITTHLALLGGLFLSLFLGITGYLTFFEATDGDILWNYENYPDLAGSPLLNSARIFVSLAMFLTFPADLMVVRGTIENLLAAWRRHARWRRMQSPVHDLRLLSALKAQDDDYNAASADGWHLRAGCTRGIGEHVAITATLWAGALGIALAVDEVGFVTDISGATTAVLLAFVLPTAIRLRLGPTPDDVLPTCHRNNWPAWFILGFGLVAFITSTVFTVVEFASGRSISFGPNG